MRRLDEIVSQCHQKLQAMRLKLNSSFDKLDAIDVLFRLFLKAESSTEPKKNFLLRHLNSFLPYANQINADESKPLAFSVLNEQQFSLALIYLKFLTIFDEELCHEASQYQEILQSSPSWYFWLMQASPQMKHELRIYYQSCSMDEQEKLLTDVDNAEIRNLLILSSMAVNETIENFNSQIEKENHQKLSFEFRYMQQLPTVPFQNPTLVYYECDRDEQFELYYYPANNLQKFKISKNDIWQDSSISANRQSIIYVSVQFFLVDENITLQDFVDQNNINAPALLKKGDSYSVYGRINHMDYAFHEMAAQVAEDYFIQESGDDIDLLNEIYKNTYHIPFITYQHGYPIFSRIQRIMDEMPQPKTHLQEYQIADHELTELEVGYVYVKRDALMHTLSVSLIACSGQYLYDLETGIIADIEELTPEHYEAVFKFLRESYLIPYLSHSQQMVLKHLEENQVYYQNLMDNHVPQIRENNQKDLVKAWSIATVWNMLGKTGLHTQVGQVFGVFNALKIFEIGIKLKYGLEIKSEDTHFGQSSISKQDWGTWIKYAGLSLVFSSIMNRYGIDINPCFRFINLLSVFDAGMKLKKSSNNPNSRDFLNDLLSCGFSLLFCYNFNEILICQLLLLQAYFIVKQYQTAQIMHESSQQNLMDLCNHMDLIQNQMKIFSVREQQAQYNLAQLEDYLESFQKMTELSDEHLLEIITPIETLMLQYLENTFWCFNNYPLFLSQCRMYENIQYNQETFYQLLDKEIEQVRVSINRMDERFAQFQQDFEFKKRELQSQYEVESIDVDEFGMSWEWLHQPSTMISAGLFLASASMISLYMMEFVLLVSISALMLQIIVPALMLATAAGVGMVCYGFHQLWEVEDLSIPPASLIH